MAIKFKFFIGFLFVLSFIGCGTDNHTNTNDLSKPQVDTPHSGTLAKSTFHRSQKDSIVLNESHNEEDANANEYLAERLKPIRGNFKRINSIPRWTKITKNDLWEISQDGEVKFYYLNSALEKIVTRQYGETFQKLSEYYLFNGELSFVIEKSYQYNRPMYYDSVAMKENNDTEAFDFDKSEIIEDRSYFEKGKLIHQLNNQDCGSPFSEDYLLTEQKRIITYFDKLVKYQ